MVAKLKMLMSKKVRFLLVLLLSMSMCVPIYAEGVLDNAYKEYVSSGKFNGSNVTDDVIDGFFSEKDGGSPKDQREVKSLMVGENGEKVEQYSQCSEESKARVRDKISSIARDRYSKDTVSNIGNNFTLRADVDSATMALSGLQEPVSTLVGIIVVLVVMFLSLFTGLDILFITMPPFRNHVDELAQNNGRFSKECKDGSVKFRFVTDEAVIAVKRCTIENGKNALLEYLKRRCWAIVVIGLAIYILLTGEIDLFVGIAINTVSGFIDVLSSFTGN